MNDEALRADGRTLTMVLRAARKPGEVHADQVRSGRQLLERELAGLVGNRERGGAAERGNHRAIERLAEFIGDLAFDQPGVGGGDLGDGLDLEAGPAPRQGRVQCQRGRARSGRSGDWGVPIRRLDARSPKRGRAVRTSLRLLEARAGATDSAAVRPG